MHHEVVAARYLNDLILLLLLASVLDLLQLLPIHLH